MRLLVGLGNPGSGHARQRHNVGFMAAERIAEHHGLGPWKKKFGGLCCEGVIGGHRVVLLKPQTYMNDSGRSVGEAQRYLRIAERDVCVVHDEIDLAPGKLRTKVGGGNAGHNGLRSITQHIGNDYARVRIGIGHPGSKELVQGYVLHDFSRADAAWLEPLLDAIAEAAGRLAAGEEARFLAEVMRSLNAGKARPPAEHPAPEHPAPEGRPRERRPREHPPEHPPPKGTQAGGRRLKPVGMLADSLKKWLKGKGSPD